MLDTALPTAPCVAAAAVQLCAGGLVFLKGRRAGCRVGAGRNTSELAPAHIWLMRGRHLAAPVCGGRACSRAAAALAETAGGWTPALQILSLSSRPPEAHRYRVCVCDSLVVMCTFIAVTTLLSNNSLSHQKFFQASTKRTSVSSGVNH